MRKIFIIVFLFLYIHTSAQKDFNILSSTKNSIIVEYKPVYLDKTIQTINGSEYFKIELLNGISRNTEIVGKPIVPTRILSIGVPSEFGNNIKIVASSFSTVSGKLLPLPDAKKVNNLPSFTYTENENYNSYENPELVNFGEYGKVRDLSVQQIYVNPVKFNPLTQEIKLLSRVVFEVSFSKSLQLSKIRKSELTNDLVINQNIAKNWGESENILSKKAVANSVLTTGDWYRFEAPEEGIYKISRSYLSNLGIDVANLDPRTIKIYNNGGKHLSWTNSHQRPIDLVENSIIVQGEDDGVYNDGDQILFYGRGVDFWEYNDISNKITRNKHFYSKNNYYWLTFGGTNGKRMVTQNDVSGTPTLVQTTTQAFRFQDNDNQNLTGSGLLHVDDDYSNSARTKTYTHMLDGLLSGSEIKYNFHFINGSKTSNQLTVDENGERIHDRTLSAPSSYFREYRYGSSATRTLSYSGNLPDNRSVLKFTFSPSSISDKGHLDYLEIHYSQNLKSQLNNQPVLFFSGKVDGIVKFEANPFNNSNFKVYNITDYENPKLINAQINGGGFEFSNLESLSFQSKYLAIQNESIKVPTSGEKISNSNLRGNSTGAKYVIISPREFREQAERLLNYRKNTAQIKTTGLIAYIDEIYNEFSGGSLDPTAIRDYLKYAYENWEIQPEYILLFGDGDFDYFNTLGKDLNFIPTFQTTESLYEIGSFPFDDYYSRISGTDDLADVGIGRLSITNLEEAKIVVDKIISYESEISKGLWRNRITLLADDGLTSEGNDGSTHTRQSENLSEAYIPNSFDRTKIYLSNYQTINTGLGRRKPECNTSVVDAINNGTLIFNYVGHGNPDVWAHEIVFDRSISIPQLRNKELFFLTAATCDFGKYDDPNLQSATEEMILMENAGMIGGLSAVRPVFSGDNDALNKVFYSFLLGSRDSSGLPIPLGKAFMELKRIRTGGNSGNDEKFHLFGDPFLRLNIPKLPVEITSINDANILDTVNIKALGQVTITGKVNSANTLNGEGIITVFDSERSVLLEDINYPMIEQGGVIFRGRVAVENGEFATSFTVPKDISYENKNGKIIAYFFNDEIDGVGFTDNIIVGGTDSSNTNDGKGPEIEILYDDETESSYLVNPNFKLRVKLNDETGLNTTGTGIGHKLEAIINDDEQNSIDLTNYFVGDLNSGGKSGEVSYNFSSLEPGEYKIKINAWDVYNNFSAQEDFFTVVDEDDLVIREVYNYPNPFSTNTYFTFQHNLTNALNVKVKIYTIAGRVIKELESFNIEDKFVKIEWNGKDEDNNKIGNGTYLYKLIVETVNGEYKENILGKMAVIR